MSFLSEIPKKDGNLVKNLRFWGIIFAISVCGLMVALEATIVSTALPTIISELGGSDDFTWPINAYLLSSTALMPLYGQLANIFGRRWPMILSTAAFVLGSGICGGAVSLTMLIAGRVVQGIGAGGIAVLIETIICDLVPLRQRGMYFSIVLGIVAAGTALGPFFGGLIVDYSTWRWIFYLNLPIGGVALALLFVFLRVNYTKAKNFSARVQEIDYIGTIIFVLATSSVLIALSWAGSVYPWSSYQVLVPLIVGLVGLVGFFLLEASSWISNPMVPHRLFSNRTSATAFALTFIHGILAIWAIYFLPIYFQGVLGSTPSYSGVQLLPTILITIPFAGIAGIGLSVTGRYRPIHLAGFALMTIGYGLFTLLEVQSSTAAWAGFQVVASAGSGLIVPTLLPAVMAPLDESDTALAAGTWVFMRSFGLVWGIAIPAAIFSNRIKELAGEQITDPIIRGILQNGLAYAHATPAYLNLLPEATRSEVILVIDEALRQTWQVAIGFAGLGFLLVGFQREIPLRETLETNFGLLTRKNGQTMDSREDEEG